MRRLEHCNIVKLKYFFYSSGEKVGFFYYSVVSDSVPLTGAGPLLLCPAERRSVPQPSVGVYSRDGLQGGPPLQPVQADDPHQLHQAVHVPAVPQPGLHPLAGHLPPGHQAAEPAARPRVGRPQAVRLRQRQAPRAGRTQCVIHLLALLPSARAYLRRHRLHHQYRYVLRYHRP